jgi:hypothetical protein
MAAAIPFIPAIAAVASTAIGAYSAYSQGQSQREMANYNAQMAQLQGQREQEAAAAKAELYQQDAKRRLATMRASYLASGVSMEGTPLLTLMESAQEAAKNEVRIRRQGEMASWGLLSEANLAKMQGRSAYTQGLFGAGSSLLGGAARAYGIYGGGGSSTSLTADPYPGASYK